MAVVAEEGGTPIGPWVRQGGAVDKIPQLVCLAATQAASTT